MYSLQNGFRSLLSHRFSLIASLLRMRYLSIKAPILPKVPFVKADKKMLRSYLYRNITIVDEASSHR